MWSAFVLWGSILVLQFPRDVIARRRRRGETQREMLDHTLQEYDINEWPHYQYNGSTKVEVELFINAFGSLNAAHMDYSIDVFLRQKWNDTRLNFQKAVNFTRSQITIMDKAQQDKIWKPDTFFENVKVAAIHQVTTPNILLRIKNTGEVLYTMRVSAQISCHLELRQFPLDYQICHLHMSSYANTDDVISYRWSKKNITWSEDIEIAQFDLLKHNTSSTTYEYSTGRFSGLSVHFFLRRQNGYHVLQTYIPTVLIVSISWVSFWLDPNAVPGRVTLGVTTLLTLTTLASGIRQQLPPVSYVKAIDVWIGMCMIMVFGALLEFTLVNWLANKKIPPEGLKCPIPKACMCLMRSEEDNKDGAPAITTYVTHARAVDRFCRVFFPTVYVLFNFFYWPFYIMWQHSAERHLFDIANNG